MLFARLALAATLISPAILKALSPGPVRTHPGDWDQLALASALTAELIAGALLLSGRWFLGAWMAVGLSGLFLSAQFLRSSAGRGAGCSCFGATEVPPLIQLGITVGMAFLALSLVRQSTGRAADGSARPS